MSNPLLRPNDPRFQKPSIADAQGKNRFAEETAGGSPPEQADQKANLYSSAGSEARPYEPKFETTQQGRAGLLLTLASVSLLGILGGALHLLGIFGTGSMAPMLALVPAMVAWFLAHEDLKAIRQGAMSQVHRSAVRMAYWLAVFAFLGCASLLATMVYQQLDFLPSTF